MIEDLNAYKREHYRKNKVRYKELKHTYQSQLREIVLAAKDVPCTDCGLQFPPCAMDFDHTENDKEFNVGHYKDYGKQRILDEITKCEVVCANCHRVRTYERASVVQLQNTQISTCGDAGETPSRRANTQ